MCFILCIQISKVVECFCGVRDDKITVFFQGQRVFVAKLRKKPTKPPKPFICAAGAFC